MPDRPVVGGPLDSVNDAFHDHYDQGKRLAQEKLPIVVVLADELVLCRGEVRARHRFGSTQFHTLKSAAHCPIALFAALHAIEGRPLEEPARRRLAALRDHFAPAAETPLVAASLALLERVLEEGRVDASTLTHLARKTGPALLDATNEATRIQLKALHFRTEEVLATMSAKERAVLRVVVTGDHQARRRSLAMQYFQKRLGEKDGVEDRVLYAEGVTAFEEALALVGSNLLNRAIARAFFDDEKRLQQDVLGEAAEKQLSASAFSPIE